MRSFPEFPTLYSREEVIDLVGELTQQRDNLTRESQAVALRLSQIVRLAPQAIEALNRGDDAKVREILRDIASNARRG